MSGGTGPGVDPERDVVDTIRAIVDQVGRLEQTGLRPDQ
jgi:hypothetical protein